ncbi:MAG: 4Fe-4S cluster-binding domain-containing protein, partial [Clostridia bacterium]|nr:4Fe-4S cluster-binding domain-containing protein [Clostridia bacterium]
LEALRAMNDDNVNELLSYCDVLVDGPFILAQRDLTLTFKGSRNQRIIDMNETRKQGEIVLLEV